MTTSSRKLQIVPCPNNTLQILPQLGPNNTCKSFPNWVEGVVASAAVSMPAKISLQIDMHLLNVLLGITRMHDVSKTFASRCH